jgi:hypothetical protein
MGKMRVPVPDLQSDPQDFNLKLRFRQYLTTTKRHGGEETGLMLK